MEEKTRNFTPLSLHTEKEIDMDHTSKHRTQNQKAMETKNRGKYLHNLEV